MVGIFFATVFACYFAAEIMSKYFPANVDSLLTVLGIISAMGCAAEIWQGIRAGKAYMRSNIYPVLAVAVRPLRPTATEIREVLRVTLEYEFQAYAQDGSAGIDGVYRSGQVTQRAGTLADTSSYACIMIPAAA